MSTQTNNFSSGFGFEDRVKAYLDRQGFEVETDPALDHEYKLDLSVHKFPKNPKHYSLGVQLTQWCDNLTKLQDFFRIHTEGFEVVDRVLYLEMDQKVNFERGGGHVIATALSQFIFDSAWQTKRIAGVKIHDNLSYEFFDLAERIASLSRPSVSRPSANQTPLIGETVATIPRASAPAVVDTSLLQSAMRGEAIKPRIAGYVNAYYPIKNSGFITAQDGLTYFFHRNDVADEGLRDRILALPFHDYGMPLEGCVEFIDGGMTKPGAKYPQAKAIRLQ